MLFKELAGVDAFPLCLDTTDVDEIVAHRPVRRADVRRHQPRGHRRAALLRGRAAAAGDARHPGLPRRPARHRGRGAGRAGQRAEGRAQAGGGRARRGRRRRGGGPGLREDHPRARRARPRGLRHRRHPAPGPHGPRRRARARWPRARTRAGCAAAPTTRSRAPTSSSASRRPARSPPRPCARWRGRDRVRHGQPGPRDPARGRLRRRGDHGHGPLATTRTRSTTCSPSRASSAARWTCARGRSTRR